VVGTLRSLGRPRFQGAPACPDRQPTAPDAGSPVKYLHPRTAIKESVFPIAVSIAVTAGGVAGYRALLAPYGLPLGLSVAALSVWIMVTGPGPRRRNATATT
jgi:hypothetical protein